MPSSDRINSSSAGLTCILRGQITTNLFWSEPWAALNKWNGSDQLRTLEAYVAAIATIEEFWAVLTQTTAPEEDILIDAIQKAKQRSTPDPTVSTADVLPHHSSLPTELRNIPLLTIPLVEDPVPT